MFKIIVTTNVDKEIQELKSLNVQNEVYELELIDEKYQVQNISYYVEFFSQKNITKSKVGIIRNGEILTELQQNKLLKLFEEANFNHYHYLYTDKLEKIISTLQSRAIIETRNEKVKFQVNTKLDELVEGIFKSNKEVKYYYENEEIFKKFFLINESIKKKNYTSVIKECSKVKFDAENSKYFIQILLKEAYLSKDYQRVKKIFEFEKKFNYQLNYNLSVQSMMIALKTEN